MKIINELTVFEVLPYVGTDIVKFGLTEKEVNDIMGPAESLAANFQGKFIEHRSYMNVAYTTKKNGVVDHIGFGRQMCNVHLNGIKIFQVNPMDVLRSLSKLDPEPLEFMNSIVFMKLGISMTGFLDEEEDDDRAMTVFIRGRWDSKLSKMSPVRF